MTDRLPGTEAHRDCATGRSWKWDARAMSLAAYTKAGLAEIAAAYAFGIAKAHALIDGNKRTAYVIAMTFLRMNGHAFRPDPVEGVRMTEGLATGQLDERSFADWIASQWKKI